MSEIGVQIQIRLHGGVDEGVEYRAGDKVEKARYSEKSNEVGYGEKCGRYDLEVDLNGNHRPPVWVSRGRSTGRFVLKDRCRGIGDRGWRWGFRGRGRCCSNIRLHLIGGVCEGDRDWHDGGLSNSVRVRHDHGSRHTRGIKGRIVVRI